MPFDLTPETVMLIGNAGLFVLNLVVSNKIEQIKTMIHKDFVSKSELHKWLKTIEKDKDQ